MKKNNDEYIYDDFVFKKLTSNNLGEVNPEDICIYATAFPGAMGWGGATQIITKDNNRYMSTLESLDDEKESFNEKFFAKKMDGAYYFAYMFDCYFKFLFFKNIVFG